MVPSETLLASLGLYPAIVRRITLLHRRHGHALYRVECARRSYILKLFAGPGAAPEVQAYDLLRQVGVPTLPVHGEAGNALVLEDLVGSDAWRLAGEDDLERWETGIALADWYRVLHTAGRRLPSDPEAEVPRFLHRETDALTPMRILEIGRLLKMGRESLWHLAAGSLDALKNAVHDMPATLTYNDFHWTNLAMSRDCSAPRAVVFDYHLLGIGMACSDVRNVTGELGHTARIAFWERYGPMDEREVVLDAPLATLYALDVAQQRPRFPDWAEPLVQEVEDGTFEANLRRAIAATY
jgi:hypothetical protein